MRFQTTRWLGLVCLAGAPFTGFAQTASTGTSSNATITGDGTKLQEVVVTAERRVESLQKAGVSISVRSGDVLLQEGKYTIQQILEDVPAVVTNTGTGENAGGTDSVGSDIIIRGVASNTNNGTLPEVPTTAVYTDGVYEGIGGDYDIDRVEVLRGPQGTLYGRSATAGVVAIHTRDPIRDKLGGDVAVELGNYDLRHYTGAVNIPLGDTMALRVAGNEYKRDGYYTGEGSALEKTGGRVKFLYEPTDDLSVLLGAALQENTTHTGGPTGYEVSPGSIQYSYRPADVLPVVEGRNSFRQYWARVKWNLGPVTLTYTPALRTWYENAPAAVSFPFGALSQSIRMPLDQYITHELHLESSRGSRLTWQAGALYYDNRLHNLNSVAYQSDGAYAFQQNARKETKDEGVFGEATYAFTDATRVTAGARYDYTYAQTNEAYLYNQGFGCNTPVGFGNPVCTPAVALPGEPITPQLSVVTGPEGTRRFYNVTYKARLEHDLTRRNMVYGMVSTGFVPGDVQVNEVSNTAVASAFREETLTSYEIGSKNRFFDDSLQINGDIWYYRYGGFQQTVTPDLTNPGSTFTAIVPARLKGVELEMLEQITPHDRASLSYSYTDGYYVDEPAGFVTADVLSHISGIAPHTASATYDHIVDLPGGSSLVFHADARYISAHQMGFVSQLQIAEGMAIGAPGQAQAFNQVGGQVIGDLSGLWTSASGKYSVTGYVRNLGNNRYVSVVQMNALGAMPNVTATPYDPRTFGVILAAHF